MKKLLLLVKVFTFAFVLQANAQSFTSNIPNNTVACDLSLSSLPDAQFVCSVMLSDLSIPSVTDSCGNLIIPTTDAVFPITQGTTTIAWTYTDMQGDTFIVTQDIIVADFVDPIPDVPVLADFASECSLSEADLPVPTATDNCSGTVIVTNNATFPITTLGVTPIVWTFTDAAGNATSQLQDIIIYDNTDPVRDLPVLDDITAECSLAEADLPIPTATDNCSTVTVTNNGVFPITTLGTTTIVWTYTDASGNSATQTQDIIIYDFTDPVPDFSVLADITAECSLAEADLPIPTATDNCSGIVTVTHDGVFPITTFGTTTITWTYTDASGNSTTQTQDIIIYDFTDPTPDTAVLSDIISECSLSEADLAIPTATDNCSAVTVTSDAVFPITTPGTTVITWTFTDASGNSTTQTQDVIIFDFTDPVPNAATLSDIVSDCPLTLADIPVPTASDNCTAPLAITNDGIFPMNTQGVRTITWTYADASGNIATQTQDIIINPDTAAPVPDVAVLADINVQCTLTLADVVAPTATDCWGPVTVTNDATFPINGSTMITWTYEDANGNTTTQTQNVIVDDTTGPTPDAPLLADVLGQCSVLEADVIVPTATDNCSGPVTVTSDAIFPITSSTTITWTYEDTDGNTTTQTQNVIVSDTTGPIPDTLILPDLVASCSLNSSDVVPPTATDNCAGVITGINSVIFPITTSGVISWSYDDGNGNVTIQNQNVIIDDMTAPVLDMAVLADITAQCSVQEADVTAPTATDDCAGIVTATTTAVFPITASGTITWMYDDTHGNTVTQTQEVIIQDNTAPVPDAATLADITGQCAIEATEVPLPSATDNCSGTVTVTSDAVFPITASTTITWTFEDASGNTATQTQNVVIEDTTAPVLTVGDLTASVDVLGNLTVTPDLFGTSSDNCGSSFMTVVPDTFTCLQLGDHTVIITATDLHGNTASQSVTLTVTDPSDFCSALATAHNDKVSLVLYPNPTSNIINIEPGTNEVLKAATLYSLSGQVIFKASYADAVKKYSISLANYAAGTYVLKLETASGTITKRIVKQ